MLSSQTSKALTPVNGIPCEDEARIVRQFIEAMLFEQLVQYTFIDNVFCFQLGNFTVRAKGVLSAFGRVRLNEASIRLATGKRLLLDDLSDLVNSLSEYDKKKSLLIRELKHTLLLCRWNRRNIKVSHSRRPLSYLRLESEVIEGHPYHPCFKSRTGFSIEDHQAFGPENASPFKLHWLAIKREYLLMNLSGESELTFWKNELGQGTYALLLTQLQQKGGNYSAYSFIPVHPWQWSKLTQSLRKPIAEKHIISLGELGDDYVASISLRTMLNISNVVKASIKLPLNVVNTSSLRTIEPHSVCTAPYISKWLNGVIDNDRWLQRTNTLLIQKEYAGLRLRNPGQQFDQDENTERWVDTLAPCISAIFRDASPLFQPNHQTVPFAVLAMTEQDGKPFVSSWIEKHGIEAWLDALINVVVIPVWHLLVHHGIAVEAHAQNMTLLLRDGLPKQIVLRDFHESLEFVEDFVADKGLIPPFHALDTEYKRAPANHYYWMDNIDALRELFFDTVFVYNLSEISRLLDVHHYCDEATFYSRVNRLITRYNESGITSKARIEQIGLFRRKVRTESLLKKKLMANNSLDEYHHEITNPLANPIYHACGETHAKYR